MKKILLALPLMLCNFQAPLAMGVDAHEHPTPEDCIKKYCALRAAVRMQDYAATKQLLESGVNANPPKDDIEPLWYAKSIALAELLISHGATISSNILDERCTDIDFPLELIQFYLACGAQISAQNMSLHNLAREPSQAIPGGKPYYDGLYANRNTLIEDIPIFIHPSYEPKDMLATRLAKARLFLDHGLSPYDQCNLYKESPLHRAARKQDLNFCQMLVDYETVHQKEFLTFLLCVQRIHTKFYTQKDLLRYLWQNLTSKRLLEIKDVNGKIAYEYCSEFWRADWLKPPK